jgi:hypothetical protein
MPAEDTDRVYVIATTADGTAVALEHARRLGSGDATVVLVVPAIASDGGTTPETDALLKEYGSIAARAGVGAPYICVCKQPQDVAGWFTIGQSTVVIGGDAAASVRPSPEEQLARVLTRRGHHVLFVDVTSPEATAR